MLTPNSAAAEYLASCGGVPRIVLPDGTTIDRPHRTWTLHQLRWRWLLDSYEGGEAYRQAVYGLDGRGLPVRNLIRHKREYPSPEDASYSLVAGRPSGTDMATQATDDDYEWRRAMTPVPTFLPDVIKRHLGKIYRCEIQREGPRKLADWWVDVDGRKTSIDTWMSSTVAPLILILGHIDILAEPPSAEGETVKSKADEARLKLNAVRVDFILPENIPWWVVDRNSEYVRCLVREVSEDGAVLFRYWDRSVWQIYGTEGKAIGTPVGHGYGRVPIVRLFDRRRPRERFCGLPRYEAIAEIQRTFYNKDSESSLADSVHAFPLLQGPGDYLQEGNKIPIGPNWLLPMFPYSTGAGGTAYQGFEVVSFPSDGQVAIRENKGDLCERADKSAMLTKPAGQTGTTGKTVAQSGVAKSIDANEGHDLLGDISRVLRRAELQIAELVMSIPHPTPSDPDSLTITYPTKFSLLNVDEFLAAVMEFYTLRGMAGTMPEIDEELLCNAVRQLIPGLEDEQYQTFDDEIRAYLAKQAKQAEQNAEAGRIPDQVDEEQDQEKQGDEEPKPEESDDETEELNGRSK